MPSIDGNPKTNPSSSASQEEKNEPTSSGTTSDGRKVSVIREGIQKVFNRENAKSLFKGFARFASITNQLSSVEPTTYIQKHNSNKVDNLQQTVSSVDPEPDSSVDPVLGNTVTTPEKKPPQKLDSSSELTASQALQGLSKRQEATPQPADTRDALKYSMLSQEEKEKKTADKLNKSNPTGTSGSERELQKLENLLPIEGSDREINEQLITAIKTLETATPKMWNNSYDATTTIRRVTKDHPALVAKELRPALQSLARHISSPQSALVQSVLTTIDDLASTQPRRLKDILSEDIIIPKKPIPLSSCLTGFIIDANSQKKLSIKQKAQKTLAHIKLSTSMTDAEWVKHIADVVEQDIQRDKNKDKQHGSLKLLSKQDTAAQVVRQVKDSQLSTDGNAELIKQLKEITENKQLSSYKAAQKALTEFKKHVSEL